MPFPYFLSLIVPWIGRNKHTGIITSGSCSLFHIFLLFPRYQDMEKWKSTSKMNGNTPFYPLLGIFPFSIFLQWSPLDLHLHLFPSRFNLCSLFSFMLLCLFCCVYSHCRFSYVFPLSWNIPCLWTRFAFIRKISSLFTSKRSIFILLFLLFNDRIQTSNFRLDDWFFYVVELWTLKMTQLICSWERNYVSCTSTFVAFFFQTA